MKHFYLTLWAICLVAGASTQSLKSLKTEYDDRDCKTMGDQSDNGRINPLAPSAFDKFIMDQYNFTILGSPPPQA